jgi:adenosine deaminase
MGLSAAELRLVEDQCTTLALSGEAAALLTHTPLTETDLLQMALQAAEHSFLPAPARAAAAQAVRQWAQGRGLSL